MTDRQVGHYCQQACSRRQITAQAPSAVSPAHATLLLMHWGCAGASRGHNILSEIASSAEDSGAQHASRKTACSSRQMPAAGAVLCSHVTARPGQARIRQSQAITKPPTTLSNCQQSHQDAQPQTTWQAGSPNANRRHTSPLCACAHHRSAGCNTAASLCTPSSTTPKG
jgi:hypothetical protein